MFTNKKKIYSIISIVGFSIALSLVFCIYGYISHETSYDKFFPEGKRYRLLMKDSENRTIQIPLSLSFFLKNSFPDNIDCHSNVDIGTQTFTYKDVSTEIPILLSDSSFFQLFDFQFIYGDPVSCLLGKNKLVITESVYKRFFEEENPVGTYVVDNSGTKPRNFEITAVIKDPPLNSHLKFEGVSSAINDDPMLPLNWEWFATRPQYIKIKDNIDITDLERKMSSFYNEYKFPEHIKIEFENIESIHLNSKASDDQFLVGKKINIYLFWIVLTLLLFVAYINHFNIFGIKVINKAKDYGVRKVLGASNFRIVSLIFLDSIKFYLITIPIVLALAFIIWPIFTSHLIIGGIPYNFLFSVKNILLLLLTAVFGGIVTASIASMSIVAQAAKDLVQDSKVSLSINKFFKSTLLIFQFVFTYLLITCSIIFVLQLSLINKSDLGFDKDNLIILKIQRYDKNSSFLNNLRNYKDIQSVAVANFDVGNSYGWVIESDGTPNVDNINNIQLAVIDGDLEFPQTLGVKLETGRFFSRDRGIDLVDYDSIAVLNKNGIESDKLSVPIIISNKAKQYLSNPTDPAVGQVLNIEDKVYGTVVGVIDEVKGLSLRNDSPPLLIRAKNKHNYFGYLYVRLQNNNIRSSLDHIENEWKNAFPGVPFSYSFAEDRMQNLYDEDLRISKLLVLMAAITIALSYIGLFGILSFDIRKRFKEIGIRKVLGSPNHSIILTISRHYIIIIVFAIIASIPISLMMIKEWLNSFTEQIGIEMLILTCVISAILLLFLISLTLYSQMNRAIGMKPVLALRKDN